MASVKEIYKKQIEFQKTVVKDENCDCELPKDDVDWFVYHVAAMVEELGEVMKADKRWKTHRNKRYEKEEKMDEIADVAITAMNMAIFSGMTADEFESCLEKKIKENMKRMGIEIETGGNV